MIQAAREEDQRTGLFATGSRSAWAPVQAERAIGVRKGAGAVVEATVLIKTVEGGGDPAEDVVIDGAAVSVDLDQDPARHGVPPPRRNNRLWVAAHPALASSDSPYEFTCRYKSQ
jgi:hypothetical protein